MTKLTLFPSVVWAPDDRAWPYVSSWYDSLDSNARVFIRACRNEKQIVDSLDGFIRQEFEWELIQAGVSPCDHGMPINVVTVSYGMGPDAFCDWPLLDRLQDRFNRGAVYLERQEIILANPDTHAEDDRGLRIEGDRYVPWLVTTTTNEGRKLTDSDLCDRTASLLDVLTLAERIGGEVPPPPYIVQSFYGHTQKEACVRLPAFSRYDFERVFQELVKGVSQGVLRHASQSRSFDADRKKTGEQYLQSLVRDFDSGRLLFADFNEKLFDAKGLGAWGLGDLLTYGRFELQKVRGHIECLSAQRGDQDNVRERLEAQTAPSGFSQKLVKWLARMVGLELKAAAGGPTSLGGYSSECAYVIKRLDSQLGLLNTLAAQVEKEGVAKDRIPSAEVSLGTRKLEEDLTFALKLGKTDTDIFRNLNSYFRKELENRFQEALSTWEVQGQFVDEFKKSLASGKIFRFAALLRGGDRPRAESIITSLKLGEAITCDDHRIPCAGLRFWPNRPAVLIAASEPIPLDQIQF